MPSKTSFRWNGDAIIARVAELAAAAVDDTTQAVDDDASGSHWWNNRTGYGERHIVTEAAKVEGDRIRGRVGTTYSGTKGVRSFFYGLFLEIKHPWLRPAADRQAPLLRERLVRRARGH